MTGLGQQIGQIEGDDHGRRGATGIRNTVGTEQPVADVFEGVVHPLPVGPGIGLLDPLTVHSLGHVQP